MLLPAGSEADFSSSSSTGSLKTRGNLSSAAKKAPSRRYDVHICGLLGSNCRRWWHSGLTVHTCSPFTAACQVQNAWYALMLHSMPIVPLSSWCKSNFRGFFFSWYCAHFLPTISMQNYRVLEKITVDLKKTKPKKTLQTCPQVFNCLQPFTLPHVY